MLQYVVGLIAVVAVMLYVKFSCYVKSNNTTSPKPTTPLNITVDQVSNYDDRPWRPFRWPYHQTVAIFRLDINHWLDMDKYYVHYINEKKKVFHEYGRENVDWLPESEDACLELMETVVEHMLIRYPKLFSKIDKDIIRNEITGEVLNMTLPLKEHPLIYISKLAKEDFYLLLPRSDGLHYLVAAVVAFPGGGFSVSEILGQHIDTIHQLVPYYKEKLQKSMEKWFSKLKVDEPIERATWNMTWDHQLRLQEVYKLPKYQKVSDIEFPEPEKFVIRIDRQSIRKLSKTGVIVFTNHPLIYPVDEMKDEPMVPLLIKKMLFEGPEDILNYKNFPIFRQHIKEYLESLIKRQVDKGLIDENSVIKTLPTYPFAYWVKTDFDYVNGWNNPSQNAKRKYNWLNK